jgi:hypothetical protein
MNMNASQRTVPSACSQQPHSKRHAADDDDNYLFLLLANTFLAHYSLAFSSPLASHFHDLDFKDERKFF